MLLWDAERFRQAGRPARDFRAVLDRAAGSEFPPKRRFLALFRRAEFEREIGNGLGQMAAAEIRATSPELAEVAVRDDSDLIRSCRVPAAKGVGPRVLASRERQTLTESSIEQRPPAVLRLPLREVWQVPLDRKTEWALLPESGYDPGHVTVAGNGWLASRGVTDGAERWRTALAFAPTWLTLVHDDLIIAGDNGAARLCAADGHLVWQFRLPESAPWFDRPGWRDPAAMPKRERLNGFQWAGGRLVIQLGDRSLLVLDGSSGEVLWQRLAPLAAVFRPASFVDQRHVVVQSSDGRRRVYDAADGRVLHEGPAPTAAWPSPPTRLGGQRLLVVEDGRLVALDRSDWEPVWAWDLPRPVSLTGQPPRVRLLGGQVLVGVPRNDCYEIERLEISTGRPVGDAIAVGREPVDLNAVAFDGERLTVAADGELKAIDCHSGRLLSRRKLEPAERWRVESAGDGLLLWTPPAASSREAPRPGQVCSVATSRSGHQRVGISSPPRRVGATQSVERT